MLAEKIQQNMGRKFGTIVIKKGKGSEQSATSKQEALAELFIEDLKKPPKNRLRKSELMKMAGYSAVSAKANTFDAFTSQGFLKACEARGLSGNSITKAIDDALNAGVVVTYRGQATETNAPDHRVRLEAMKELATITGLRKERHETVNANITLDDESLKAFLGLG